MTLDLTYIIGGVAATGVVLYFAWPAFKQMINIKAGNAVNGSTKASEKLRAEQITLTTDVKKQLTAVATIKGAAEAAERDVKAAEALVVKLTGDFKMAVEAKASDAAIDAVAEKVAKAKADVVKKQQAAATAHTLSVKAVKALDTAREALSQFADKIDETERTEEMTTVLNTAADTSLALKDLNDRISGAGAAANQAQKDLDTAQARLDLSQGSDTDREIAEISQAAARKAAREQLEAELGMTKPAAAPAAPTEQK
ncbi:MAG: hypothetical protein IPP57_28670 [Candidatus Obscuribacter sp.]|nr:hypothetical protein [Candidatus Obscuribacter sp.]